MFEGANHPGQIVKVSNGVDVSRFSPGNGGARVRAEFGVPPGAALLGIVCRLDHWKGVDVFLEAARLVALTHAEARFVVVGGPIVGQESYARALEQRARDLGVGAAVTFTGWRFGPDDMPDVYRALDVLVLASVQPEPFGLTIIEAMACGKPVIATNQGGPVEIVVGGVTGLLVPPRDPEALAAAMRRLIDDPDTARAMGEAGRQRAVGVYDVDKYVAAVEGIYQDVLKPPCAASPGS